jgi:hypothetical protein
LGAGVCSCSLAAALGTAVGDRLPVSCVRSPDIAILEVMDEELSRPILWAIFIALGLAGFIAARRRPWFAVPPTAFAAILGFGQLAELRDPSVGPAILQEGGRAY